MVIKERRMAGELRMRSITVFPPFELFQQIKEHFHSFKLGNNNTACKSIKIRKKMSSKRNDKNNKNSKSGGTMVNIMVTRLTVECHKLLS